MSQRVGGYRLGIALLIVLGLSVRASGEVFGLPNSDKLLTFEVEMPRLGKTKEVARDGRSVELLPTKIGVTTREGTTVKIQDKNETNGYWFAFIATIQKSGAVTVSQFGIVSPRKGVENATAPFHFIEIARGGEAAFFGSPGKLDIKIRYLGVRDGSFPDTPPFNGTWDNSDQGQMDGIHTTYGDSSQAICCVGRGPIRVCADYVDFPGCGSCGSHGGGAQI